ncbi:hypothetical protein KAF25_008209 [Fusarium avenaceum]|uniref:Uncharacterized protein n=1 Tax=Fusarium avenaceum TaxID=40199 RepID=A0A9P7HAC4_9HYPO|nr:hypothetical protein KAF25_008209 [Fusarium avenaceum]
MEELSSPGSIGSHTTTAPTSASKVTYTTAGTPYNPSTSQPLQPPARRGRSLKWPAGLPAAGLSLLPRSVLATLPLKTGTRSSSIQQYSPRAQFDGASSPLNEPDHRCINMSTQVPRMGSSTTPSPLASLFSEVEQDTFTDADQSDESDDEGELGMDPLLSMPVKSLHNLASYPNPNQKRAQKALLRGLKPALGLKMTTRSDEPSTPLPRPVGLSDALNNNTGSHNPFTTTLTETPLIGRSHDDAFWNPHDNQLPSTLPGSSKGFNRAVGSNPFRTASTLGPATVGSGPGPGVPLPLTAGPPGQRQYRPSTFESTFKALRTNTPSQDAIQDDDDDVLVITRQTLRQAGISTSGLAQNLSPFEESTPSALKDALSAPDRTNRATEDSPSSSDTIRGGASADCLTNASQYTGKTAWSRIGTPVMTSNCWASPQERSQPRYISGPRIRTAKDVEAHSKKLNRAWYHGAEFLMATSDEIALKMRSPNGKGRFGAIGDGRPLKGPEFPPPVTIEEANQIPVTDHVQPLLNVAFVNVKRFIDEEWQKKNDKAEAATK